MGLFNKGKNEAEKAPKENVYTSEEKNKKFEYDPAKSKIYVAIVRVDSTLEGDEKKKPRTFIKLQTYDKNIEKIDESGLQSELVFMEVMDFEGQSIKVDDPKVVELNETYINQVSEINSFIEDNTIDDEAKREVVSQRLSSILKLEDSDLQNLGFEIKLTKDGERFVELIKNPEFVKGEKTKDENGDRIYPIKIDKKIEMNKSLIVDPETYEINEKNLNIWQSGVEKYPPEYHYEPKTSGDRSHNRGEQGSPSIS